MFTKVIFVSIIGALSVAAAFVPVARSPVPEPQNFFGNKKASADAAARARERLAEKQKKAAEEQKPTGGTRANTWP